MIDDWRGQIDEVDREILRLLNLRAELVRRIGREKRARGLPLRSPMREEEVLHRVKAQNPGPLSATAVERIFRLIIAESRGLQLELELELELEEVGKNDRGDEAQGDPGADRGGE